MTNYLSAFDPRGPVAAEMTFLMWVLVVLGAVVFVGFSGLLLAGLFRRTDGEDHGDEGVRRWLFGGGLVLPAVVIAIVFGFTISAMRNADLEPGTLTIEVIGHQWWWEVRYDGFTTANEIVIPVDEPVTFELESEDVIHSFWVPELGGKIDLFPDMTNTVTLQADDSGEYGGVCAEFCGLQHARMRLRLVAVDRAEFERWANQQAQGAVEPGEELSRRGREVFTAAGCGECHTIRGTSADGGVGPDLTHLASRETLASATLTNEPGQLAEWIRSPSRFKSGVEMPDSELSDAELDALVAYLGTLR